jgi:lysophospholipase L1-like esterase
MKSQRKSYIFKQMPARLFVLAAVAATLFALQACTPSLTPQPGTGALGSLVPAGTPVRYVALGNSLTAGFQSGAVVGAEVQYAYPVLLAQQLNIPIGDAPEQFQYMRLPNDGGIGTRNRITAFSAQGLPQIAGAPLSNQPTNLTLARPYNNLGIPGALLRDMMPPANDPLYPRRFAQVANNPFFNPFFGAVLRGNPQQGFAFGANCVEQAARLQPNLVTLWIGNNDVLGYASSGGTSGTNFASGFGTNPMVAPAPTEVPVFTAQFNALLDSCVRRMPNAKFVVGNVPDVIAAPYFTTAGPQVRAGLRDALNNPMIPAALVALIRQALPMFPNGIPVRSSAVPGGIKPLSDGDLFTLPAGLGGGVTQYATRLIGAVGVAAARIQMNPAMAQQILQQTLIENAMPNDFVLDEAEQAVCRTATSAFNAAIAAAIGRYSANKQAVLFDAFAVVNQVRQTGYPFQGQTTTPTGSVVANALRFDFVSGGFFSLDGIHPSSRGYGAVTNEMIKVLNREYGANIPLVNLIDIPGLPVGQPTF